MPGHVLAAAVSALVFISVALVAHAILQAAGERRSGTWRLARLWGASSKTPGGRQAGGTGGVGGAVAGGSGSGTGTGAAGTGSKGRRQIARSQGQLVAALRPALAFLGKAFERGAYADKVERELARADIPLRGSEFVVLNLVAVLAGLVLGVIFTRTVIVSVALGMAGGFLPNMYIKWKQGQRLGRLNGQIADALAIMANSLRAGYSFLQAMDMVSREMSRPISDEFSAAMKEMSLGAPTEAALTSLADRVGSEDLELVVTAVLIQRQVGGNLAEVLDNIAHTIRERVRIRGEIRTLTAQGRLSGIIIGILPVALGLLLYAMNPSYIMLLFTHPIGRVMIVMAAIGEAVGAMVIRRIVTIEV
ncbi:MAG: type II secretion system F family protein [Firmicutes bacterium]|jgi:tight adherence protein B|nr:type II secretion system F family protein [Bacillota bacterium]MDH7495171.1 type II secretion system F family protein [Bacillota bacterium]